MARVGGRNAAFAWVVGVGCLAILGVLAALALPLIPASMTWFGTTVDTAQGTSQTAPTSVPVAAGEAHRRPQRLVVERGALRGQRALLARGAVLTPSKDAPVTTATALVSALSPDVQLTCFWHADAGTVSTTIATVPPDAGAIAAAALPGSGFTCESVDERTRCTRTDGDLTETIEAGGGLWLSTSESAWHPAGYVSRTGDRIWG